MVIGSLVMPHIGNLAFLIFEFVLDSIYNIFAYTMRLKPPYAWIRDVGTPGTTGAGIR